VIEVNQNRLEIKYSVIWKIFMLMLMVSCLFITIILFLKNFIFGFLYLIIFSFIIYKTIIDIRFFVEVNNDNFKVRSGIFKNYQFNISEINKVAIYKDIVYGRRRRIETFLEIKTKSKELKVEIGVQGFGDLVEYLLLKYNMGEIKKEAISSLCEMQLIGYRDIYKRLKDNKENVISETNEVLEPKQEMYKTSLTTIKNQNKFSLNVVFMIGMWLVLSFTIFILALKVSELFLLLLVVVFLFIIPITIYFSKKSKEIIADKYVNNEVTFYAQNGKLYIDKMLLIVEQDKSFNELYVRNMFFYGIIKEPYIEGFKHFLKQNNIEIFDVYDEYKF